MRIFCQQVECLQRSQHSLKFHKKWLSIFEVIDGIPGKILTQKGAHICVEGNLPIKQIFHIILCVEKAEIFRKFAINVYRAFRKSRIEIVPISWPFQVVNIGQDKVYGFAVFQLVAALFDHFVSINGIIIHGEVYLLGRIKSGKIG